MNYIAENFLTPLIQKILSLSNKVKFCSFSGGVSLRFILSLIFRNSQKTGEQNSFSRFSKFISSTSEPFVSVR